VGVDPTRTLLAHAEAAERVHPVGVVYRVDDGTTLGTVSDDSTDGVTAALSLNNIADLDAALGSVRRVLRPGGFLAFAVPHPCFDAPATETISTPNGLRRVAGNYFAEGLWRSTNPHSVRRAGNYHRPRCPTCWLNRSPALSIGGAVLTTVARIRAFRGARPSGPC
jgi:SAM-dependent methyltransferase